MKIDIEKFIKTVRQEVKDYAVPVVDLIAVQTNDPFKVLVATILSARTKDETTARASTRLFKEAPDVQSLALLSEEKIRKLIYPVGFYKSKAGYLAKLPEALKGSNNIVPKDMDSLLKLPGVGRKTANLVLAVAYHKEAICVDTHVHRIMNILGFVQTKTPFETEMALRERLPQQYWLEINSILVAFGQGLCRPVAPHCDACPVSELCPKTNVTPRRIPKDQKKKQKTASKIFISWNVNGIRALEKKGFIDIVTQLRPDIFAIQETKAQPEQLSEQLKNIEGFKSYWHSSVRKGYSGLATYTKQKPIRVIEGLGQDEIDQEGRVLTLEFDDFYFINAYFPNAQHGLARIDFKLHFNYTLQKFADLLAKEKSVVICGDFNVAHKPIDLKNPKTNEQNPGYTPQERAWMDQFIEAGFIDTFRKFHHEPDQYTWWSYRFNARERNIGWRIDYFFVDPKSNARVLESEILSDVVGSDHCPVILEFK